MIRAVSSNKFALNWIIIAVVAFIVGAVGMGLFSQFQKKQAPATSTPAIQQTVPQQPSASPIIKEGE